MSRWKLSAGQGLWTHFTAFAGVTDIHAGSYLHLNDLPRMVGLGSGPVQVVPCNEEDCHKGCPTICPNQFTWNNAMS